ncbi:hypothetical protein Q3G72_011958 [Acer saccharum]|nr:hypothetical protein Q3G72_011958 [Acer saccharum]
MDVLWKKITIFHRGDNITSIHVVHRYRYRCSGELYGASSNVCCQPLPRDPTAKLRELRQFINGVIPIDKFHKNISGMGSNSTVSSEFGSNLSINFTRECDSTCSICLREFEDGEDIRVLPECEHHYHVDCIDEWLCSHSSCPICRANTPIQHKTSSFAN